MLKIDWTCDSCKIEGSVFLQDEFRAIDFMEELRKAHTVSSRSNCGRASSQLFVIGVSRVKEVSKPKPVVASEELNQLLQVPQSAIDDSEEVQELPELEAEEIEDDTEPDTVEQEDE